MRFYRTESPTRPIVLADDALGQVTEHHLSLDEGARLYRELGEALAGPKPALDPADFVYVDGLPKPQAGAKYPLRVQAGEWTRDGYGMVEHIGRWYVLNTEIAACVLDERVGAVGWHVSTPGEGPPIASGPELGELAQTLADLTLCSEGYLSWGRIAWASPAHAREAASWLWDHGQTDLTLETLPAVLAAVREVQP